MTATFDMTNISLTSDDDDSLPSLFFSIPIGDTQSIASMSGRDSLERRRRRQTKENVEMLGMLESMSDDESYVESTLASLEYSTSTNNGSLFLKEIADTTAPYNMPQWQVLIRKWSRRLPKFVLQKRHLSKFGPWMLVLVVYVTYRVAWSSINAAPSTISDTERITLRAYRDNMLHQSQTDALRTTSIQHGVFQAPKMQGSSLVPDGVMEDSRDSATTAAKYHIGVEQPEDNMALPPKKEEAAAQQVQPQQPQQPDGKVNDVWKPRTRDENKVDPPGIISAGGLV